MSEPKTLVDLLRTERSGEQRLGFFEKPGQYRWMTVAELRDAALRRLGDLQRAGLTRGQEVVMPVDDPAAFVEIFWACQLGGLVAVPLAPPSNESSRSKIVDILERRADAALVIEEAGLGPLGPADLTGRWTWPAGDGAPGEEVAREADEIAFIQFSSGSTRAPKGVIIRQGQALANLRSIGEGIGLGPDDRTFSWMPLSHDMGLVGFHLAPLRWGADQALMPTSAFARTPLVWLQDAAALGSTILSSPNFGYRHALKSIARKGVPEGVDLSGVRLIMNGAEPISLALSEEFLDRLAPVGLARSTIFPVYGLAEATLAVTFPAAGEVIQGLRLSRDASGLGDRVQETDGEDAMVTVGCGRPLPGVEVRITGADGGGLAEDHVGRVWIRGDNVTEGYLDDPAATAAAVQGEGWLDTGDLGFMRGGALHITGRLKDLVIINGQNLYPHDLEESLQVALGVDALRVAVAPVQRAGAAEEAAVFMVHRGDPSSFADTAVAARQHLSDVYGIGVDLVVPVQQIPRTTSGKVQRAQLAQALLAGAFDEALAVLAPPSKGEADEAEDSPGGPASGEEAKDAEAGGAAAPEDIESMMCGFCADVLDGMRFGPEDNLFEQGMSSIDLAEIHGLIEARYPGGLDIRDFFDQPTIRGLAEVLSGRIQAGKIGSS